jgi:DNA polymerase III alpha subunit
MSDKFVKNRALCIKNGKINAETPELEEALKETYDTVIYQEQVMTLCQIVWGMSLGEADMVRRAIGRKDKALMDKLVNDLSARENKVGFNKEQIRHLLDNLEEWSGYLFNKSHAAAYAYTAYQTAYLKAHFPKEFYCAMLNSEVIDQEKSIEVLAEAKSRFRVVCPNIIESEQKWSIKGSSIVAGLSYVRGVGNSTFLKPHSDDINGFKEFVSINPDLSKTVTVGLVKAGCFRVDPMWATDYVEAKKKAMKREKECKDKILHYTAQQKQRLVEDWRRKLREIPEMPDPNKYNTPIDKIREMQKEALGFSGIDIFGQYDKSLVRDNNVMVFVDRVSSFSDRNGNPMWKLYGQKNGGDIECIFWKPNDNIKNKLDTVQEKSMWIIRTGKLNQDGKSCFCYDLIPAKKLA